MRRSSLLVALAISAFAAAGGASAQSSGGGATNAAGLRYLTWPGKAARPTPPPLPALTARPPAPRSVPSAAARPPSPPRLPVAAPPPAPAPTASSAPEPIPEPIPAPPPASSPAPPAADPMAPRTDAAIFRLQPQGAPARTPPPPPPAAQDPAEPPARPAPSPAQTSPAQTSRYYSVHRQAGRTPDAISTPRPVYLDALPVEMAEAPSSTDLAAPDAPPAVLRQTNGTLRAAPQTLADDLP